MSRNDDYYTIEKPMGTQGKSCTQSCQHKGLDGRTTYTPKFGWPFFAPSVSASHPIPLSLFCYPAESGKKSLPCIAVPIAAACKTAPGVRGNSCAVQGCSVLSCVSLAAPHSCCSSKKLCAVSAKRCKEVRVERRGQPSFFFLCLSVWHFVVWFFSLFLYLFPPSFPSFPLCLYVPSPLLYSPSHSFPLVHLLLLNHLSYSCF